jgi:hypothetical protein
MLYKSMLPCSSVETLSAASHAGDGWMKESWRQERLRRW